MNNDLSQPSIDNFRRHLSAGFDSMKSAFLVYQNQADARKNDFSVSFQDYFYDWSQANWELLVERVICSSNESLVIYGLGSDYEADIHSRVFFREAIATHEIICLAKSSAIDSLSGEKVKLEKFVFDAFVSHDEEWFSLSPPFDCVLMTEKGAVGADYLQVVVPLEQVNLEVRVIEI